MQALFNGLIELAKFIKNIGSLVFKQQPWFIPLGMMGTIFSFILETIRNPAGAINQLGINLIDVVDTHLPQTPSEYQLGTLIGNMQAQVPGFAWSIISEILQGIAGILAIFFLIKVYKLIPFV